jgi:phosphate starvation-inducible PhoH-like protein
VSISFDRQEALLGLCGENDCNIRALERRLGVEIRLRGNEMSLCAEPFTADLAERVLRQLYRLACRGVPLVQGEVLRACDILCADRDADLSALLIDTVALSNGARSVSPKTPNQKRYVEAVRRNDLVFVIGPAGTGKTYLAMALAVAALLEKRYKRIVLTRPAVEAGERLGFLPGDIEEKVNPYLRPLYDALNDLVDVERARKMVERGVIEVAPLAFMRGRTLHSCFVILDEAQNTTIEQMKMFLTRLGPESRAVVTGDVTQTDLAPGQASGLLHAMDILRDVSGIGFCELDGGDVVRHRLVREIVRAYEQAATRGGQE